MSKIETLKQSSSELARKRIQNGQKLLEVMDRAGQEIQSQAEQLRLVREQTVEQLERMLDLLTRSTTQWKDLEPIISLAGEQASLLDQQSQAYNHQIDELARTRTEIEQAIKRVGQTGNQAVKDIESVAGRLRTAAEKAVQLLRRHPAQLLRAGAIGGVAAGLIVALVFGCLLWWFLSLPNPAQQSWNATVAAYQQLTPAQQYQVAKLLHWRR